MKIPAAARLFAFKFITVLLVGAVSPVTAAPIPNEELKVTSVMLTGDELGGPNSNYNPRHFAGSNFVLQINNTNGTARYSAGSDSASAVVPMSGEGQSRMWSPMDGGTSTDWVLLAGGSDEGRFSRLPYDAEDSDDRIFAGAQDHEPNSFDWVDDDTIIYSSYEFRDKLFLADVTAEPFTVSANTLWNAEGGVTTDAGRIRNVRVGDVYGTHAYYAEAAVDTDAHVFALDLANGESTLVTTVEEVTGSGSWGLWTIKEVDGFLYVQTSHDGIYVYEMEGATTLGSMFTHYEKEELDDLMLEAGGNVTPNWGFDVTNNGNLMLLGGSGTVIEMSIEESVVPGDFDGNGVLDADDIDRLSMDVNSGMNTASFDLDDDGIVDQEDRRIWVEDLKNTYFGDSNLDGEFNSSDFVAVFTAGEYEDGVAGNSSWATGDWNGDREFDSSDFVAAFTAGGYEIGPRVAVASVPEPASVMLLGLGLAGLGVGRKKHRRVE